MTNEGNTDVVTFEEVPKRAGEQLTKRMLNEDFDYCMGHPALTENGRSVLNVNLTLRDIKILETGLNKYKEKLGEWIDESVKTEALRVFKGDYETKQECDKILLSKKGSNLHIQKTHDIFDLYVHGVIGTTS